MEERIIGIAATMGIGVEMAWNFVRTKDFLHFITILHGQCCQP